MEDILNITLTNSSYCEDIDEMIESIWDMKNSTLTEFEQDAEVVISVSFITLGLIFGVLGAKLFRGVAALLLGIFTFYGAYKLSEQSSGISCDSRIIISCFLALIAALLTGCVINFALFVLGAGSLMFFTHMIFVSFPSLESSFSDTQVFGRSLFYWGILLLSGIMGGCIFKKNKKLALEMTTSTFAGVTFGYGIYGLTQASDAVVDTRIFFGIALGFGLTSFILQNRLRNKKIRDICCPFKRSKTDTFEDVRTVQHVSK